MITLSTSMPTLRESEGLMGLTQPVNLADDRSYRSGRHELIYDGQVLLVHAGYKDGDFLAHEQRA
jgi:hypothetical protein